MHFWLEDPASSMGINKLQPAAAEQKGAGVSRGEAGAAPQLCCALVGIPLPLSVKTFAYTPPLQNVALNPLVNGKLWKRFECDTCAMVRGGGRGWDRGLVSSLNPLSCCLASVLPAVLEQRVSNATLHGTHQPTATWGPPSPGRAVPARAAAPGGAPSLAPGPAREGRAGWEGAQ